MRAYGWNAQLLGAFETAYGTAPDGSLGGVYTKLPFISSGLGEEQGLIESQVLGLGRDPTKPFRGPINDDGDIVVPVDLRYIGIWLKLVFGDPQTTDTAGAAPFTHVFTSGKTVLPSKSLEVGFPEVPAFNMNKGVRGNSIAFNFQRAGEAQATVNLIGQDEERAATASDAAPLELAYDPFSQFQGGIKKGGVALANITSGSFTYSNNLEAVETIRGDGLVEGVDPGRASLTGTITARFSDTVLLQAAEDGTPVDLEFAYTIDADRFLTVTMHEVYLPKPKQEVTGPGGIEAGYDFQGAKNAAQGVMVTVTLKNDVDAY